MRSRATALIGSAAWFLIAPGTLAILLPWSLTGWVIANDFGSNPIVAVLGGVMIFAGFFGLVESFGRFALEGLATPAPITPTRQLIVTGLYRHVRNPMYVSVIAVIIGQALLIGQGVLLVYAAVVWLAFHLFVLFYEEPRERERFPEEYSAYSRSVPRWLPRLRP